MYNPDGAPTHGKVPWPDMITGYEILPITALLFLEDYVTEPGLCLPLTQSLVTVAFLLECSWILQTFLVYFR